jgi:hypothetical protein
MRLLKYFKLYWNNRFSYLLTAALGTTEPMAIAAAGSGPAEDCGFLWAIKIRNSHFFPMGSKAVGPMS